MFSEEIEVDISIGELYIKYFFNSWIERRGQRKEKTTWDYGRLAKAVSLVSERDATSKKDLWYAIAQQYFGEFRVCKRKIDRLRTIWRTNCGNIRELVRDFRDTVNEPVSVC